jgi:hypothetical protein
MFGRNGKVLCYNILIEKHHGKGLLRKWDNLKMDVEELSHSDVNCRPTRLILDREFLNCSNNLNLLKEDYTVL